MRILAFDMDGTLTESRQIISIEMLNEIERLSKKNHIAILTGGSFELVEKQILKFIDFDCNIYIFTMSGSRFYVYKQATYWFKRHISLRSSEAYKIPWQDKGQIFMALNDLIQSEDLKPATNVEDMVEDRGSQITFSAIGRNAPKAEKDNYDPKRKKRKKLAIQLNNSFCFLGLHKEYQILIGGTTSIDIVPRKFSKGKALKSLMKYLNTDDIIFFGDKLQKGGNDYSVKLEKIKCVEVKDDKDCIRRAKWLKDN